MHLFLVSISSFFVHFASFFVMLPLPPKPTLFPYTTLFRSLFSAGNAYVTAAKLLAFPGCAIDAPAGPSELLILADERSEEHTSELQSRQYLVFRLLLEKKIKLRSVVPLLCTLVSALLALIL